MEVETDIEYATRRKISGGTCLTQDDGPEIRLSDQRRRAAN